MEQITMEQVREKAYAKVNLGLDVTGRREDGYHLVSMVMQTIGIHDDIVVYKTKDPNISLDIDYGGVHLATPLSAGDDNLCARAARVINERLGIGHGYFIHLTKSIPVAAGMAGGSSDAAAVLRAINRLEDAGLTTEELQELAVKIGADVPYCVVGGTMQAEGIGEKLSPLKSFADVPLLVAKPPEGVSTAEVYHAMDEQETICHPDMKAICEAVSNGDVDGLAKHMGNVLMDVTLPKYPVVGKIRDLMLENGALGAMMTGSGPTVFGIYRTAQECQKAAEVVRAGGLCETVMATKTIADITK
jgi:4-diphosphocytidyl-2-C-methyl-D-erythritol kinase